MQNNIYKFNFTGNLNLSGSYQADDIHFNNISLKNNEELSKILEESGAEVSFSDQTVTLSGNISLNSNQLYNLTPNSIDNIFQAIKFGTTEDVIKNKEQVNSFLNGSTPLEFSMVENKIAMFDCLLELGANSNNFQGIPPLLVSYLGEQKYFFETLLPDCELRTARVSISIGHPFYIKAEGFEALNEKRELIIQCVKSTLEKAGLSSDFYKNHKFQFNILDLAILREDIKTIEKLITKFGNHMISESTRTILEHLNSDIINQKIEAALSSHQESNFTYGQIYSLSDAVLANNAEEIEKYKEEINVDFFQAIQSNDSDYANKLLDIGADCNEKFNGLSPLFQTCFGKNNALIERVLNNTSKETFQEPINISLSSFNVDYNCILNNKAIIQNYLDKKNLKEFPFTAFDVALLNNNTEIVEKMLEKHKKEAITDFSLSIYQSLNSEKMNKLLSPYKDCKPLLFSYNQEKPSCPRTNKKCKPS